MKIGAVLQVRAGSRRLPGKALLLLGDKTITQIIIEKAKAIKELRGVVVATTEKRQDDAIEAIAGKCGVACFRGSEHDVLKRTAMAAQKHGFDAIVRLTADNPFVSTQIIRGAVKAFLREKCFDYFFVEGFPEGFAAIEIISTKALLKADRLAKSAFEREHVVPFIIRRTDLFKVKIVVLSKCRMTVDTKEDFSFARGAFKKFGHDFDLSQLIELLVDGK
jgi:spore coat polysaccharide biosynthesis protein SpsF